MTADKLLPCPFCGNIGELRHWKNWQDVSTGDVSVGCYSENCPVDIDAKFPSEQDAITAWNTRVQPTPAAVGFLSMEAGICVNCGGNGSRWNKHGYACCFVCRPSPPAPTPASAVDGEIEKRVEQLLKDAQETVRPHVERMREAEKFSFHPDQQAALQPVADFTDKYNSSDKPWCCWINQESGEECKNPARWDIRWPPFGYEDNTQSCDDHIFNLRGEGRNEIRKIPEPVAAPDMVMVPREPTMLQILRMVDTYAAPKTDAPMHEVYEAALAAAGKA